MTDIVSEPTQALVVRPTVLPSTAQLGVERDLAVRLAFAEGFLPKHFFANGDGKVRAAKVLAAIEYGRAVGVEPMIALQNITMIDGKAGATALLIGAQLRRAGYKPQTIWLDAAGNAVPKESAFGQQPGQLWGCKVILSKGGEVTGEGVFSMTDAQRAGLVRDASGWQRYPKDMLYARALTQSAREGAQDAVLGMQYTAEELGADVDADGSPVTLPPMVDDVIDGEVVPGVSEQATKDSPPAVAAIQPTPPAPSVEQAEPTIPPDGSATGSGERQGTPAVNAAPAPQTSAPVSVMPLSGPALGRRMGAGRSIGPAGRSIGPAARRTNVVEVPQGATVTATAPEAAPAPTATADAAPSQPAQPALTDEPDLPPALEPEDPGKAIYLNEQRGLLRVQTAELFRVNALLENVKRGLEGKEPAEVPPPTPSEASDQALAARIDNDWPGRTLANLGEVELQALSERFESNLAKKREVLKERGISEE